MFAELWQKLDVEALVTQVVSYLPNVVAALVLVIVFWIILVISRKAVNAALRRARVPESVRGLCTRFLKYGVVIIAALSIAHNLGFNITSVVAGLGIAGLAISLAAQDTVTNIIAGITLAVDRPFKRGDWVSIGDVHASVTEMRLRTTVLTTFDNETMVMPNKDLASQRIVNYTLTRRIRVRVPVGIAYKENVAEARKVMLATTQGDERILADPEPRVIVQELGDSSVNLEMRFWTEEPWDMYPLRWEYIEKCKRALDEADIEIPFPHLQMFLERSEGLSDLVTSKTGA